MFFQTPFEPDPHALTALTASGPRISFGPNGLFVDKGDTRR
jgi:hypothetical protein